MSRSSNRRRRDPFFFRVGRDPQTRFAGGPDEGDSPRQARFPSFFSPLFWGVFPGQATRVAVAGRESLDAGLPGPLPGVFPPPPALPSRPARRTPSRSDGSWSSSRLIRRPLKSIGFAFVPGLRVGAAFKAGSWPRTPSPSFSPFFFRSIPRRSVSPGATFDLGLDLKSSGRVAKCRGF